MDYQLSAKTVHKCGQPAGKASNVSSRHANTNSGTFGDKNPGLDAWFYELAFDPAAFKGLAAMVDDGTRTVLLYDIAGTKVYRKWDRNCRKPTYCGAREKIAADLAQLYGVSVPPVLLWHDDSHFGCVQKAPPNECQELEYLCRGGKEDPEGFEKIVIPALVKAYDPANFFFDLWLCNRDRFGNYHNVMVSETSTNGTVWLIDFNCALGHNERPWTDDHCTVHGIEQNEPPVPLVIRNSPEWVQFLSEQAENLQQRLAAIDEDGIDEICFRAFAFYGTEAAGLAKSLSGRLKCRKHRVKEWTWQLLSL